MSKYSDEEVQILLDNYVGDNNVAEVKALAKKLLRTESSVRSKLVSLRIYKKGEKAKTVPKSENTKLVVANKICQKIDCEEHLAEGLAKANRDVLDRILSALTES